MLIVASLLLTVGLSLNQERFFPLAVVPVVDIWHRASKVHSTGNTAFNFVGVLKREKNVQCRFTTYNGQSF